MGSFGWILCRLSAELIDCWVDRTDIFLRARAHPTLYTAPSPSILHSFPTLEGRNTELTCVCWPNYAASRTERQRQTHTHTHSPHPGLVGVHLLLRHRSSNHRWVGCVLQGSLVSSCLACHIRKWAFESGRTACLHERAPESANHLLGGVLENGSSTTHILLTASRKRLCLRSLSFCTINIYLYALPLAER